MDEKDQTILWMARALAQAKQNEARLHGEVVKGNAIIASLEERVANLTKDAPRDPIAHIPPDLG